MFGSTCLALVLLQHCFLLVTTLTLPPQYSAPRPPDGFRMKLNYQDDDESLNPIGLYICAIQALAVWSGPPWDSIVNQGRDIQISELNVGLKLVVKAKPDARDQLKLSYLLLGLYRAMLSITEENRFRVFSINLYKEDSLTGVVVFRRSSVRSTLEPIESKNSSDLSLINRSTTGEDSGHFVHPRFPWLELDWTFSGQRILASEIFTAIMDAIVSTADELGTQKRAYIYGVSLSGDVAMNFHSIQGAAPINNQGIQTVLLMVAREIFMKQRRFQELRFTYLDHGRLSAEGFFMKMGGGRGNRSLGVASDE